jgi:hypothetical protein
MKFLCLAYLDRSLSPGPDVAAEYGVLGQAMRAAGVFVDSGQLSPGDEAKLVRVTAWKSEIRDGSPAAAGQQPTSYFLIDCLDLEAALGWAARIPAATYGSILIRPPR